jgi:CheY-like chemotaxis protein
MNALPARSNGTPDLSGMTVLIVDDQPDAREIVIELLKRAGAAVTAAASTEEGLECLAQSRPDVLVSDIAMPGRDGYELIRTLRTLPADHGGQTPAIALTAFAREEDRVRALSAGFQMHVAKPVEPAELLGAIAQLAGRASHTLSLQS